MSNSNLPPSKKESVAHKVHRLWDKFDIPACGLVDNASILFLQNLSPSGSRKLLVCTTRKVQGSPRSDWSGFSLIHLLNQITAQV